MNNDSRSPRQCAESLLQQSSPKCSVLRTQPQARSWVIPHSRLRARGTECLPLFLFFFLNSSAVFFPPPLAAGLPAYEVETFSHTVPLFLRPRCRKWSHYPSQHEPTSHFTSLNSTAHGFTSKPWALASLLIILGFIDLWLRLPRVFVVVVTSHLA